MKCTAECACSTFKQDVDLLKERHVCDCRTCRLYTNTNNCIFYTTPLQKINVGNTASYKSGHNSERLFCAKCFAFIGMRYYDQDTLYLNKSILSDTPKNVYTYRHRWTKKPKKNALKSAID